MGDRVCPFCAEHGAPSSRCTVADEMYGAEPDRFKTWRECAEYQQARAIHSEREVVELRTRLGAESERWIAELGTVELTQKIAELESRLRHLAANNSSLSNRLRSAEDRADRARHFVIRDVLKEIGAALAAIECPKPSTPD